MFLTMCVFSLIGRTNPGEAFWQSGMPGEISWAKFEPGELRPGLVFSGGCIKKGDFYQS